MRELNRQREESAWRKYEETKYLYRVDHVNTLGLFTKEGFTSQNVYTEDGRKGFCVFVDLSWAADIAINIGLDDAYVLYRIPTSAIPRESIIWDSCADAFASVSLICLLDYLPPKQIKVVNVYQIKS